MNVVRDLRTWRALRRSLVGRVGFVPTMGALHEGHAALLRRSVAECEHTVLSIYVNPTQFDRAEDLAAYPCTLERDIELADSIGVRHVLLPEYGMLYPDGYRFRVEETGFSRELCGAHRPGHFTGVMTVVMKLLNLVRPERAYFGEKDFQQLSLIRDMCAAFFLDAEIVACPTVREADGLALSSRNVRLDACGRARAPELHRAIASDAGDDEIRARLELAGFDVDYIVTRDGRRFAAASLPGRGGPVRLIDNVSVETVSGAGA